MDIRIDDWWWGGRFSKCLKLYRELDVVSPPRLFDLLFSSSPVLHALHSARWYLSPHERHFCHTDFVFGYNRVTIDLTFYTDTFCPIWKLNDRSYFLWFRNLAPRFKGDANRQVVTLDFRITDQSTVNVCSFSNGWSTALSIMWDLS